MSETVYLNGHTLPLSRARISIYDGGFLHGAGLFETMRADFGHVFRPREHLDRLLDSAEKLGLPITQADLPAVDALEELVRHNGLETARLRMTVTVGSLHPATTVQDGAELTVCVTAAPLIPLPKELFERGAGVIITSYRQSRHDPVAGHKTINYLPRLLVLRAAQKVQCTEALWFTPENLLAEGCISSVFVIKNGSIATPPLETPVLPGVSRAVVLELAAEQGITAEEKSLTINDVLDADELFLTNSSTQVLPVCRVERKEIGNGQPGLLTMRLRELFLQKVEAECRR